jgi:hypothetical protein
MLGWHAWGQQEMLLGVELDMFYATPQTNAVGHSRTHDAGSSSRHSAGKGVSNIRLLQRGIITVFMTSSPVPELELEKEPWSYFY